MTRGDADPSRRSILVTGASSGIGWCLTATLAEQGHRVFATARSDAALKRLDAVPNVTALPMDVRDPEAVDAASRLVAAQVSGLDGLVNNAGIGPIGELATFDDAALRDVFDVNVFGPHRVVRAFSALLIAASGRIVNIGSQGGSIAGRNFGPYCMTKHALEAYTDALDEELSPHGVRASIVQPGGIVSDIGVNAQAETIARLGRAAPPFRAAAQELLAALRQPETGDADAPESATNRKPSPPAIVADAVLHALFADSPKRRYLVGTRWEGDRVLHALLARVVAANDSPSHGCSRDELLALLDSQLVAHDLTP